MTSRSERKALVRHTREQCKAWPVHLEPVPESDWPPRRGRTDEQYPKALWRSRRYLVQMYPQPPFNGVEVRRLSVNRVTLGPGGHWDENIPWDDLMRCKRESGHGDWYGIEIYPRDRDIENVANMRHLWLLAEPLPIGWFEGGKHGQVFASTIAAGR
jgi:hypothetical protein